MDGVDEKEHAIHVDSAQDILNAKHERLAKKAMKGQLYVKFGAVLRSRYDKKAMKPLLPDKIAGRLLEMDNEELIQLLTGEQTLGALKRAGLYHDVDEKELEFHFDGMDDIDVNSAQADSAEEFDAAGGIKMHRLVQRRKHEMERNRL